MADTMELIGDLARAFDDHLADPVPGDPRENALRVLKNALWQQRRHLSSEDILRIWDHVLVKDVMER